MYWYLTTRLFLDSLLLESTCRPFSFPWTVSSIYRNIAVQIPNMQTYQDLQGDENLRFKPQREQMCHRFRN